MGARNGILVRNRLALEAAREIDVVIFDKTGTLTKGQFGVVDIATADGWDADRALALAAALEEMLSLTPATNLASFMASANNKAQTVVYLMTKDKILAAISITDVIRPQNKQAVEELNRIGMKSPC